MVSRITGLCAIFLSPPCLGPARLRRFSSSPFACRTCSPPVCRGAFNAAFVPLFSERLEAEGSAALELAGRILSVLLAFLTAFTLLGMVFMPGLVLAIAQGFTADADKFDQAVHYARIAFPIFSSSLSLSLFAGVLNAPAGFWLQLLRRSCSISF